MLTVTIVSGQTNVATPNFNIVAPDKLAHFLVFGLIATAIIRLPVFEEKQTKGFIAAVVVTSLFGFADEMHQSFTPGRAVEFDDWIADTAGAIVAATVWLNWKSYRRLLQYKPHKIFNRAKLPQ